MFDLKYTLAFEDYRKFLVILSKRQRRQNFKRNAIALGVLALSLTLLWIATRPSVSDLLTVENALSVLPFGIIYLVLFKFWVPRMRRKNFDAQEIGLYPIEVHADAEQLRTLQNGMEMFVEWDRLEDVTLGDEILLLWLGPVQSLIIPDRAFTSRQQADAFINFARARVNAT